MLEQYRIVKDHKLGFELWLLKAQPHCRLLVPTFLQLLEVVLVSPKLHSSIVSKQK